MLSQFFTTIGVLLAGFFPVVTSVPIVAENPALPIVHPEEQQATVLFGGDMMFDRFIRIKTDRFGDGFALACVQNVLADADVVVANLEGPITPYSSVSASSTVGTLANMTFTFPTTTADMLARHNIRLVNLGNNHIQNFGVGGMQLTTYFLARSGVDFFGAPPLRAFARRDMSGVPLAFISYNEFGPGRDDVVPDIEAARRDGYLPIVYTHWGNEYATTSAPREQRLAHSFIDAGAEIVIGSHPHVIQEHEMYRGKHIYYSLGNLIFDQYWNTDVRTGLLLRVTFTKNGVQGIEEIYTELQRDGRTCLLVE